jgi:signal transduction histidine kinase
LQAPSNPSHPLRVVETLEFYRNARKAICRSLAGHKSATPKRLERIHDAIDEAMMASMRDISSRHEAALKTLEEEMDLRERFLAALSHDLRNPVAAAKMTADFLLSEENIDRSNTRRLLSRISKGMERVEGMIRNLLDALRIKNRQPVFLNRCEFDLVELLKDTLQGLEAVYGKRFELFYPGHVWGLWDMEAIRRVLENLCTNAVKYGSRDKNITLTVMNAESTVQVRIHNQGQPIAPGRIPSLFDIYARTGTQRGSASAEQSGWGVGLYLVRSFVEAHGGFVQVESNAQEGTTFSFCLPKRKIFGATSD